MFVQCTFEFSIDTFLHLMNQMICRNVIRFWNCKSILYTESFFQTYFCVIARQFKFFWRLFQAFIAETAVWPIFFLMNIFFAFKGSKLFIIICSVNLRKKKLLESEIFKISAGVMISAKATSQFSLSICIG